MPTDRLGTVWKNPTPWDENLALTFCKKSTPFFRRVPAAFFLSASATPFRLCSPKKLRPGTVEMTS